MSAAFRHQWASQQFLQGPRTIVNFTHCLFLDVLSAILRLLSVSGAYLFSRLGTFSLKLSDLS